MAPSRTPRLRLQPLEDRCTPAGVVRATLAGGVLSLSGDDAPNTVAVGFADGTVTLTPDATTAINAAEPGEAVTLTGQARSLRAVLRGGVDTLTFDPAADVVLPDGASFNLGDGENTLSLVTAGRVELGRLAVTAGEGLDTVNVDAGVGLGRVRGPVTFNYGDGASVTRLFDLRLPGPAGVAFKSSPVGIGSSSVHMDAVDLAGPIGLGVRNRGASFQIYNSHLSRLVHRNNAIDLNFNLVNTDVAGAIDLAGTRDVRLTLQGNVGGPVRVTGAQALFSSHGATIAGDLTVTGTVAAGASTSESFTVRDVRVVSPLGTAGFAARGSVSEVAINGDLTVDGGAGAGITFSTGPYAEVQGDVRLLGGPVKGPVGNSFGLVLQCRVHGDVTLDMPGGNNGITIGTPESHVELGGALTIRTGTGNDVMRLAAAVRGPIRIDTGSGADKLTVDGGAAFDRSFTADLGSGDDVFEVGQAVGAPSPATFTGVVTVRGGKGNETLRLGRANGDANTLARFLAIGNRIDGGAGWNEYDPDAGQFEAPGSGSEVLTLVGWTPPPDA